MLNQLDSFKIQKYQKFINYKSNHDNNEKPRSIYSQGDQPKKDNGIDHIYPYQIACIQYSDRQVDLVRETKQISQIHSVKNVSQISKFVNSISEIGNIFDAKISSNQKLINRQLIDHEQQIHQNIIIPIQQLPEQKSTKSIKKQLIKYKNKIKILKKIINSNNLKHNQRINKIIQYYKKKQIEIENNFKNVLNTIINKDNHLNNSKLFVKKTDDKTLMTFKKSKSFADVYQSHDPNRISQKDQIYEEKLQELIGQIESKEQELKKYSIKQKQNTQIMKQIEKKIKQEKAVSQKIMLRDKNTVQNLKIQNKRLKYEFEIFMKTLSQNHNKQINENLQRNLEKIENNQNHNRIQKMMSKLRQVYGLQNKVRKGQSKIQMYSEYESLIQNAIQKSVLLKNKCNEYQKKIKSTAETEQWIQKMMSKLRQVYGLQNNVRKGQRKIQIFAEYEEILSRLLQQFRQFQTTLYSLKNQYLSLSQKHQSLLILETSQSAAIQSLQMSKQQVTLDFNRKINQYKAQNNLLTSQLQKVQFQLLECRLKIQKTQTSKYLQIVPNNIKLTHTFKTISIQIRGNMINNSSDLSKKFQQSNDQIPVQKFYDFQHKKEFNNLSYTNEQIQQLKQELKFYQTKCQSLKNQSKGISSNNKIIYRR